MVGRANDIVRHMPIHVPFECFPIILNAKVEAKMRLHWSFYYLSEKPFGIFCLEKLQDKRRYHLNHVVLFSCLLKYTYYFWNLKDWSQLRPRTQMAFVSYLQSRCHDGKSEWLDTLHCCINFPRVLYEVSVTRYLMTYVTIYYRHNHIYYAMRWADQPLLKIHSHWEQ